MVSNDTRESEVLWTQVVPFGTKLEGLYSIAEHNWDFSNLEDAFKEGGVLHSEKVFLFTCTEIQLLSFDGERKVTYIPVVVVIVSPCPPSDKIGFRSRGEEFDEIIHMEDVKVDWVPYFPVGDRGSSVEPQIFLLRSVQRDAALGLHPIKTLQSCTPCKYFNNPFKTEESVVVGIICPAEEREPIVWEYDCEFDDPETFTNAVINGEVDKDAFKELVKEKVEEAKREASRERLKAQEESMSRERDAAAFEKMRFYKFYPVATPDTPDLSSVKSPYINRYYGKAHLVF